MYINKVTILGNLTRDVELKSLPTGMKVANIGMATNRTWKDQNGQKQEAADYHNVAAFGKTAELVAQYMKKGDQMFVEGRLQTRSWDDQTTGKKQYRTEVIADRIQFGSKRGDSNYGTQTQDSAPKEKVEEAKFEDNLGSIDYGDVGNVDDIPF